MIRSPFAFAALQLEPGSALRHQRSAWRDRLRLCRRLHGFEEDPLLEAAAPSALLGGKRKKLRPGHADGSEG
jgi:hypothetical protein